MLADHFLELSVVHEPGRDVLVLLHVVDERTLQRLLEDVAEVLQRVRECGLSYRGIGDGIFADGIQERLVGGLEAGSESLVEDIDELRQLNSLVLRDARPDGRRSADFPAIAAAFTGICLPEC